MIHSPIIYAYFNCILYIYIYPLYVRVKRCSEFKSGVIIRHGNFLIENDRGCGLKTYIILETSLKTMGLFQFFLYYSETSLT